MSAGEITHLESSCVDGPGRTDTHQAQSESNLYSNVETRSDSNTNADSDSDSSTNADSDSDSYDNGYDPDESWTSNWSVHGTYSIHF